ncbi:MAG: rhamnulose-1-phosphate aldolase [Bacteroidales bacterium]|nr:rhamnulose-1-phosphate aldolase [Bacteroidales bacterium]
MAERNIEIKRAIKEITETGKLLWQKGWAERNAGNISIRIEKYIHDNEEKNLKTKKTFYKLNNKLTNLSGKVFLVTATGSRMRDIGKNPDESILTIKISDKGDGYYILSNTKNKILPTSELIVHLLIHQELLKNKLHEIRAIAHTHPTELIALTHIKKYADEKNLNKLIKSIHPENTMFVNEGVGFIPFLLPGSYDIAEATVKSLQKHKLAVWEKHGCFAVGKTVSAAFDIVDMVNKSAKIFFLCKAARLKLQGLSEKQIQKLSVLMNNLH